MGWQTFAVIQLFAGNTIINPNGIFTYSSAPAAGNLVFSAVPSGTTQDTFGNKVISGAAASYGSGVASALIGGAVLFYTGSLAGGWTFQAQVEISLAGVLILNAAAGISMADTLTGGVTVTGGLTTDTLTVGGSSSTGAPSNNTSGSSGLPDGTIHGTSGGASAGTAHTHGPGSFAVGNGNHTHTLSGHTHAL